MTKLSHLQKAKLAQLARRAYGLAGRAAAEPLPPFDDWRRLQVVKACGKPGLTACTQADFNPVAAWLHSILGEDGIALDELVRDGTERRRQPEVVMLRELASAGLAQAYAETISRSRFGCAVGDTNDRQFEQLLFTIKARLRARRKKAKED